MIRKKVLQIFFLLIVRHKQLLLGPALGELNMIEKEKKKSKEQEREPGKHNLRKTEFKPVFIKT